MALQGFNVRSPSTVILDDDRDPDVSWANHEARYPGQTNRGGVDVVAPVGTAVHAWADGTVRNLANQGSAGNVVHLDLAHDPGWSMEAKHLSRFAVEDGQWVAAGTVIGYSGTSGGVAPHVHYNLLDPRGIRRNPWHYIDTGSASAGTIAPLPEEEDMPVIVYDKARTDSAAFLLDLTDPTRPLSRATGAEYNAAVAAGMKTAPLEPADFQALLRSRGVFIQDAAQRITPYTAPAVAALSPVQRQYSINHGGFLAVRAAG